MIKNKRQVVLKEFLFSETTVTQDFCNEFIVPAYRKPKEYKSLTFQKNTTYKPNELSENSFSVGDEWLYFKFYCGEQVLEKFLKGPIAELIDELNEKQLVEKWFFIRYKDRLGNHLRLRLKPFDKNLGTTIAIVKKRISPYEKELLVWKVATDTYLREIQRYGAHAIDKTESLYHKDSEATLNFLKLMGGSHNEKMRWLFSLISIDFLLTDFGYGFEEKSNILKIARLNFSREFGRKGQLNKQVNTLFKNNEKEIDYFLDLKNAGVTPVNPLVAILRLRSKKYAKDILYIKSLSQDKKLPENLSVLVLSYMHLICNRIFIAKQRIHEMVVYDMLYKYYMKRLNQNS
nr:thiopeptide-type bacteriocin biosynthesis protein [uncultured Allomuricauda sp.]